MSIKITGAGNGTTLTTPDYVYFGDSGTNGSWRIYVSGSNLVIERRESAVWVEKGSYLAS